MHIQFYEALFLAVGLTAISVAVLVTLFRK